MQDTIGLRMNLVEIISKIFPQKEEHFNIREKYSSLELEYQTSLPIDVTDDQFIAIKDFIPKNDICTIKIIFANNDPIILNTKTFENTLFTKQLNEARSYHEDGESINIKLTIQKETKSSFIHIYNFDSFVCFSKKLSTKQWLDIVNKDLDVNNVLKFKILEDNFDSFWSNNIIFTNNDRQANESSNQSTEILFNENCHFGNYDEYSYTPLHFHLTNRPRKNNNITNKLDTLSFIFSITSIFDITSLNDKNIFFKLNGYKTIEGQFNIDTESTKSRKIYVKLFSWIYSEPTNSSDKIGLARNILSIYLKDNSLNIDESVYFSVLSGFKTYLQENINKYIEVRNKITDQLQEIGNRAVKISETYLNNYQKSNLTFITFFVSVFTIRALITQEFSNVFSRESTIIALSILLISFGYMVISTISLNNDIKRLQLKYNNIKKRFEDLLDKKDINKILGNDEEFNDEIKYIQDRRTYYAGLWIFTIIIFTLAVVYLSSYISISNIIG